MNKVRISPVNSIVFLHGGRDWESPEPGTGRTIWTTPSCIVTPVFPEIEGATEVVMGAREEVDPGYPEAFVGTLETPDLRVEISTVDSDDPVLSYDVQTATTKVHIWHSDPRWPEIVTIGVEPAAK